mmetsp:Transcript_36406/g.86449  ORF Transcript_36406/g.86449 Transcript_36406/m.86449 type:complete len:208 (-) Transcript_36406:149-772(-)
MRRRRQRRWTAGDGGRQGDRQARRRDPLQRRAREGLRAVCRAQNHLQARQLGALCLLRHRRRGGSAALHQQQWDRGDDAVREADTPAQGGGQVRDRPKGLHGRQDGRPGVPLPRHADVQLWGAVEWFLRHRPRRRDLQLRHLVWIPEGLEGDKDALPLLQRHRTKRVAVWPRQRRGGFLQEVARGGEPAGSGEPALAPVAAAVPVAV